MNTPSVKGIVEEIFEHDDVPTVNELIGQTRCELSSSRSSILIGSICKLSGGDVQYFKGLMHLFHNDKDTLGGYLERWREWGWYVESWRKIDYLNPLVDVVILISKIVSDYEHEVTSGMSNLLIRTDENCLFICPVVNDGVHLTFDDSVIWEGFSSDIKSWKIDVKSKDAIRSVIEKNFEKISDVYK